VVSVIEKRLRVVLQMLADGADFLVALLGSANVTERLAAEDRPRVTASCVDTRRGRQPIGVLGVCSRTDTSS
jgi:hypothetical protein